MLDLRQLRYFVEVANQQHFGKAAKKLFIAQPALSRQVRMLEEELGAPLFVRHPRGATPTEHALQLLERAVFVLRYVEQMKADLCASHAQPSGPVTIGLSPGLASLLAAPLALALKKQYPNVHLKIAEMFAPELHYKLADGAVDLAILSGPEPRLNLDFDPLLDERICAIGPAEDPLLQGEEIELETMRDVPLILTGVSRSGVLFELEAGCRAANIELRKTVEVASHDVARRLVEAGLGWTVHFAAPVRESIEAGVLAAVPIKGLALRRSLACAIERPLSRAAQVSIEVLREVVYMLVREQRWPHSELVSNFPSHKIKKKLQGKRRY